MSRQLTTLSAITFAIALTSCASKGDLEQSEARAKILDEKIQSLQVTNASCQAENATLRATGEAHQAATKLLISQTAKDTAAGIKIPNPHQANCPNIVVNQISVADKKQAIVAKALLPASLIVDTKAAKPITKKAPACGAMYEGIDPCALSGKGLSDMLVFVGNDNVPAGTAAAVTYLDRLHVIKSDTMRVPSNPSIWQSLISEGQCSILPSFFSLTDKSMRKFRMYICPQKF